MVSPDFCDDNFWHFEFCTGEQLIVSQCFETTVLTYVTTICALFCLFLVLSKSANGTESLEDSEWFIRTTVAQVLVLVYGCGLFLLFMSSDLTANSVKLSMALKTANIVIVIWAKRRCSSPSAAFTFFWIVAVLCETPSLYREIRRTSAETIGKAGELRVLQSSAAYILILVQCLIEISTIRKTSIDSAGESKSASDGIFARLSRKLFFTQMSEIISTGSRKPLELNDIPAPVPELATQRCHNTWNGIVRQQKDAGRDSGLVHTLWKTFWKDIVIIWILGVAFISMTAGPSFFLNRIIIFFEKPGQAPWKGYAYASAIFFLNVATYAVFRLSECRLTSLGLKFKAVLTGAIMRKSLKIYSLSLGKYSKGELVNLLAVDCDKVNQFANVIGMTVACPYYIVFCTGLLWSIIGPSSIIGLVAVLFTMPLTNIIAAFYRKSQLAQMLLKDRRLKLISETLTNIKIIKLHGWERAFRERIEDVRERETKLLVKTAWFSAALRFLWSITPCLITMMAFTSYLYLNDSTAFPPNVVFVSLFLLNSMRFSLFMIPEIVANAMQTLVSIRRIEKFLEAEELDETSIGIQPPDGAAVSWSDATLSWDDSNDVDRAVLRDISFSVKSGELVAVVGRVGCGKSSLLSSLLKELKLLKGGVNLRGTVAYVPQQAWIQNTTLKKNITFTRPHDAKEFRAVLEACCLLDDLPVLPGGEDAEIGERGINLSGGQKQRVSLARAIYQNNDVYLLDDPLSAVDAHVGAAIFKNVIGNSGALKHKTRILVTNQISVLDRVDRIVVLKNGRIAEQGSYQDLIHNDSEFSAFLKEHAPESESRNSRDCVLASNREDLAVGGSKLGAKNLNLVSDELTQSANATFQVYRRFISKMGMLMFLWNFAGFGLARTFCVLSGLWLSMWSQDDAGHTEDHYKQRMFRIGIFVALNLLYTAWHFSGAASISFGAIGAARKLHRNMLSALFRAPMSFFETTPLGRILNRFSKDVVQVEVDLPAKANLFMEMFFNLVAVVVLIAYFVPIFLLFLMPLLVVYFIIQRTYMRSARQLKQMEAVSRSPVTNHFSETLCGLSSIRAFGATREFIERCDWNVDVSNNLNHLLTMGRLWLGARIDLISNVILILSNLLIMTQRGEMDAGLVGLIIALSLGISYSINHVVHYASEVESAVIASGRIEEYCDVEPEAALIVEPRPPRHWPQHGAIVFENFSARYRDGLELVLKDVNLRIRSREKIGVVGRTGAGKSSLALSLFRIIEADGGCLRIDGIDASRLGLHDLRTRITIIPQDPVIFCGTLRNNLDPGRAYTDERLWCALAKAHIKEYFASGRGLDEEIAENGANLSMGQRQLVCLARAILQKGKILVMDEATAAVDIETDALIQQTVRSEFSECTVVTIAHRLSSILSYDRVVVMEKGAVVEEGAPDDLLRNPNSLFYELAKESGVV